MGQCRGNPQDSKKTLLPGAGKDVKEVGGKNRQENGLCTSY